MSSNVSQAKPQQNLRVQQWVAVISVFLLLVKIIAYYLTNSVAILTDALESIVNVAAGFIGLYSLYIAAKPADQDHPYGHGKAEFISAAIEGTLIVTAGALIIYKAVKAFFYPEVLSSVDTGILLVALTAVINFIIGQYCIRVGERNQSLALVASGRHLQTDTLSTLGIIAGLVVVYFTNWIWLDSAVALFFGILILYTGYTILMKSVAGIMDKADLLLLNRMVELLNINRRPNWIDLHNLRIIKYGSILHLDCHLTLPWYLNVHEAHVEIDQLASLVRTEFGESLELFVHSDGCLPFSCQICTKEDCQERKKVFEKKVTWTLDNILTDQKHKIT
ncbi:MAG: cation transporter [Bacteroidetes bacterium]|nr:cation transporter [Bacteroidota bacterium]